jgi:hypothetical protein
MEVVSCNFSLNRVFDCASAVYLEQTLVTKFKYCGMYSNTDKNTLCLGMCDDSAPTLECAFLVNNTCIGVGGGNNSGLVYSADSYALQNFAFLRNEVDYVFGGNGMMILRECIFDLDVTWTGLMHIETINCIDSFTRSLPAECPFEFEDGNKIVLIVVIAVIGAVIVIAATAALLVWFLKKPESYMPKDSDGRIILPGTLIV